MVSPGVVFGLRVCRPAEGGGAGRHAPLAIQVSDLTSGFLVRERYVKRILRGECNCSNVAA